MIFEVICMLLIRFVVEGFCGEDVEGGWGWRFVRFVWVVLWGVVEAFGCGFSAM